jgi:hypothetical protein
MDIISAYQKVGSYRGAAHLCDTTHKTVKRVPSRRAQSLASRCRRARLVAEVK